MKILFNLVAILLLIVFIDGCKNDGLTRPKTTIITGRVHDLTIYADSMAMVVNVKSFGSGPAIKYKSIIDRDGNFKIKFDQYIPQDVSFGYEFRTSPVVKAMIVHPGDSIYVKLDYKDGNFVKFSGDAEKTNTDLNEYTSEYYSSYVEDRPMYLIKDPDLYKAACLKMKKALLKTREEFIDKVNPNEEVKMWTKNYISILYYSDLAHFSFLNNRYASSHTGSALLKDYVDLGDDINDIYNSNLLNADSYMLLDGLIPISNRNEATQKYSEQLVTTIDKIADQHNNKLLKQMLLGDLFRITLIQKDIEDFDKNKLLFDTGIKAAFIKQPLLKYYAATKAELANAQKTSDAVFKNVSGTAAMSVIDSIKNQNKGKVIYLDFWATWCGPCRAEMPNSKILEKKYKDKNVVFGFVCMGSPRDAWRLAVAQMQLDGNQYFCDAAQSSSISKGFKIIGIPYYMLISKNGDIKESGNELRPGDLLTARKIDKLLE